MHLLPDYFYDINIFSVTFRLFLAVLFGGAIGMERGATKHSAGFRTHILVCVGAALAMLTNQYISVEFTGSIDPSRMGAQVITGVGFLGVGWFEHGNGGGDSIMTIILLILAGGHAGVVGGDYDEGAANAGVGGGEQGVGGHIQADMFHRSDSPSATKGGADGHFESHLFVGRPLGVSADFGEVFQDFS
jgi:hypothetical protein